MSDKHIELFKYLGIDPEFEKIEEVKAEFEKTYVKTDTLGDRKDLLKPHFAKTLGAIDTALKRTFKGVGVELKSTDIEGKSTVEIIEFGQQQLTDHWKTKEDDLKSQIGQTDDKKYKDLELKHETLKTDYGTVQAASETLVTEFATYKTESEQKAVEKDRTRATESLWGTMKYAESVPKFSKTGFRAEIENEFVFPFAEDGVTLEIRDRKTNEKIANPNKAGSFFEPAELLQSKAVEEKLWQLSPEQKGAAQKPAAQQKPTQQPAQPQAANGRPVRTLHSKAAV